MKFKSRTSFLITLSFWLIAGLSTLSAHVPDWWTDYGVVGTETDQSDPAVLGENYEPSLLGQAKFMAYQAYLAMEAEEAGSAGPAIRAMVQGFSLDSEDNYQFLLLGQLKQIVLPFYQRFAERDFDVNEHLGFDLQLIEDRSLTPMPVTGTALLVIARSTAAGETDQLYIDFFDANGAQESFTLPTSNPSVTGFLNSMATLTDPSDLPVGSSWEQAEPTAGQRNHILATAHQLCRPGQPLDGIWFTTDIAYPFPWQDPATPGYAVEQNYDPANIGQLKYLFSFGLKTWAIPTELDLDPVASPVSAPAITLAGTINTTNFLSFSINGEVIEAVADAAAAAPADAGSFPFSIVYPLTAEGANELRIELRDQSGNVITETVEVVRLTLPPSLVLSAPALEYSVTRQPDYTVLGTLGATAAQLSIQLNGSEGVNLPNPGPSFSESITLTDGTNTLIFRVSDALGNFQEVTRTIVLDQSPPRIDGGSLVAATPTYSNSPQVTFNGSLTETGTLFVNGDAIPIAEDGSLSFETILNLVDGENTVVVDLVDALGNTETQTLTVYLDQSAPTVALISPQSGALTNQPDLPVSIQASDGSGIASVVVEGIGLEHQGGDIFSGTLSLQEGGQSLTLTAMDLAGNASLLTLDLTLDTQAPSFVSLSPDPDESTTTAARVQEVSGTLDDLSAWVTVNDSAPIYPDSGTFSVRVPLIIDGGQLSTLNALSVKAFDAAGNVSEAVIEVTYVSDFLPITLVSPETYISGDRTVFTGTAEPASTISVTGARIPVEVIAEASGDFTTPPVIVDANATNYLVFTAIDPLGNVSSLGHTLVSDSIAPSIQLLTPLEGAAVLPGTTTVAGFVVDAHPAGTLWIEGVPVALDADGSFQSTLDFLDGATPTIQITAEDAAGNLAPVLERSFVVDATAPRTPTVDVLSIAYAPEIDATTIDLRLLLTQRDQITAFSIQGTDLSASLDADVITFSGVLANGDGEIVIEWTDATTTQSLVVNATAPVPALVQSFTPVGPTRATEAQLFLSVAEDTRVTITGGLFDTLEREAPSGSGLLSIPIPLNLNQPNSLTLISQGNNELTHIQSLGEVIHDSIAPGLSTSETPTVPATDVVLNSAQDLTLYFSESLAMPPANAFALRQDGADIPFVVSAQNAGQTLVFTPDSGFTEEGSTVELILPEALFDLAGNAYEGSRSFTWSTQDTTAPAAPSDLQASRLITNLDTVEISGMAEPQSTVSIWLLDAVVGTATADGTGTFAATIALSSEAAYTFTASAQDAADNSSIRSSGVSGSVTVTRQSDAFAVLSVESAQGDPANLITDLSTAFVWTFSSALDAASVPGSITLVGAQTGTIATAPAAFSANDTVLTLQPSNDLIAGETYTLRPSASLRDIHGNRLPGLVPYTFTTLIESLNPPEVDLAAIVSPTQNTSLTLTGNAEPGLTLQASTGDSVTVAGDGTFSILINLQADSTNAIYLSVSDGNISSAPVLVEVIQDGTAPLLTASSPAAGAANVDRFIYPTLTFNEAIAAASVDGALSLDSSEGPVTGTWFQSANLRSLTFAPAQALAPETAYTLSITTGLLDLAGNALASSNAINFSTLGIGEAADLLSAPILDPLGFERTQSLGITLRGSATPDTELHVLGGLREVVTIVDASGRFSVLVPLIRDSLNDLVAYVVDPDTGIRGHFATVSVTHQTRQTGVRILSPQAGLEYNNRSVMITGIMDNPVEFTQLELVYDDPADGSAALVRTPVNRFDPFFAQQLILAPYAVVLQDTAITESTERHLFVSRVGGELAFRFVSGTGVVRDYTPAVEFPENADALTAFTDALDTQGLWTAPELTSSQQSAILAAAMDIVRHSIDEGVQNVTIEGTLADGSIRSASVAFNLFIQPESLDNRAPQVTFLYPEDGQIIAEEIVETFLIVEEGVQLNTLYVNNVAAHQTVGNFMLVYAAAEEQGERTLTAVAADYANNRGEDAITVVFDSIPPATEPQLDSTTTIQLENLLSDRVLRLSGTGEPGSFIVVEQGIAPVRTEVDTEGNWTLQVPLVANTTGQLLLYAEDSAGNRTATQKLTFTHDDTPPFVVSTVPGDSDFGIPVNTRIALTFSEPMDPSADFNAALNLSSQLESASLPFNAVLAADGLTLEIIPDFTFNRADTVTVTLTAGLPDANGLLSTIDTVFSFDTARFQTTLSGVVLDPTLQPIPGVEVGILGSPVRQLTSTFGSFILDEVPTGEQILYIDGRPDASGETPQGDERTFGYLEFPVIIQRDADNSLGRPIFLVDTDYSTEVSLLNRSTGLIPIESDRSDLSGFAVLYEADSARFSDGTELGSLTVTHIDAAHIPDRLPDGSIPHFMVEIGAPDLSIEATSPATLRFPNVYDLQPGAAVRIFSFTYGLADYQEWTRPDGSNYTIDAAGLYVDAPVLTGAGFYGYIPASADYDLTRSILQGRIVDSTGSGIPGISVSTVAGGSAVLTDTDGAYSILLPEVRILTLQTLALVKNPTENAPDLVYPSAAVAINPSGITAIPDIVVDLYTMEGNIRFVDAAGERIPINGELIQAGRVRGLSPEAAASVNIFAYRQLQDVNGNAVYDTVPFMQTDSSATGFDIDFDAGYSMSFFGAASGDDTATAPQPGDPVRIVAFDARNGFYGHTDTTIPALADPTPINIDLRPPELSVDVNRVAFINGIRLRSNVPHEGIVFTDDEFVEIKTTWRTADVTPLNRPEIALPARLRVDSIDYRNDYPFAVQGGEQFRILEVREALYPARLEVLQRDTDVGTETLVVSRDGSFRADSLIPLQVITDSYGLIDPLASATMTPTELLFHVVDLSIDPDGDDTRIRGRVHPDAALSISGAPVTVDPDGFFALTSDASAFDIALNGGATARYGASYTPILNAITPDRGSQGDTITLQGQYFSTVPENNRVAFNGTPAEVISATDTRLQVIVPAGASSGNVTVTIAGRTSNGLPFEFISRGINNGSFEDGTLRGFAVTGSVVVRQNLSRLSPSHGNYMVLLDTRDDPISGTASITTDQFVVESLRALVFELNVMGTLVQQDLSEYIEIQVLNYGVNGLLEVPQVTNLPIETIDSFIYSMFSGFNRGSGFVTLTVDLTSAIVDNDDEVRVVISLKSRGRFSPRVNQLRLDDENPLDMTKKQGTALLIDNIRLASLVNSGTAIETDNMSVTYGAGGEALIHGDAQAVPAGADLYFYGVATGSVLAFTAELDGSFLASLPIGFFETQTIALQYKTTNTAEGLESNSVFSEFVLFKIDDIEN